MVRQAGWSQSCSFTPAGGSLAALNVTSFNGNEEVEAIEVTGSLDYGVQAMIAGVFAGGADVDLVVDSANLPHLPPAGLTAGVKGTLTWTIGGSTPFSMPVMIQRVNHRWANKGAYVYSVTMVLDSLTGAYSRASAPTFMAADQQQVEAPAPERRSYAAGTPGPGAGR